MLMNNGNMTGARYITGTKVKIVLKNSYGGFLNPEIQNFKGRVGEVVSSTAVAGLILPYPWTDHNESVKQTLFYYEIRLDDNTILPYVTDDCLELVDEMFPSLTNMATHSDEIKPSR